MTPRKHAEVRLRAYDRSFTIRFLKDPEEFLSCYGTTLEKKEAENTLILGLCSDRERLRTGFNEVYFVSVQEDEKICALAMQTPPHNLLLASVECDLQAIKVLAEYSAGKLSPLPGVLGPDQLVHTFKDTYCDLSGLKAVPYMEQIIHRLDEVIPVPLSRGRLEVATEEVEDVIVPWMQAFDEESLSVSSDEARLKRVRHDIRQRTFYLWYNEQEKPVSMLQKTRPCKRSISISYVYTPSNERRKGYASSAVCSLSKELLKDYKFCTLFTDKKNPTSNKIYRAIGYQPLASVSLYRFEN